MRKNEMVAGLLIMALLVGTVGFMAYQQLQIRQLQLELGETIPVNDAREWGATIYMTVIRADGSMETQAFHNVITNAGRTALRGHIGDSAVAEWNYLAIGTGSGGGVGSTTLVTEYSRYQGAYATVGSYNFTISFTWTAGNFSGQTITECGVLNAAAVGTLLNYDDSFSRGPLQASDELQVTVNFQVGS